MKNRLLEYSILRGKSEESDEKLEGKIGPVMEVHMDANAALSQVRHSTGLKNSPSGDPQGQPRWDANRPRSRWDANHSGVFHE